MTKPRVLVVEDEPHIRRLLQLTLRSGGFDVTEVGTGEAALELAEADPPDAVLLDVGLPGLDGVEVCRRLRTWSRIPIIVLSARGDESDKVRALDEGADDYITKPFSTAELLARLRVVLRRAAAERAERTGAALPAAAAGAPPDATDATRI